MSTIQQFEEAAAKATQASAQADTWANGPEGVFVDTASGPVPTIAEFNRAAASSTSAASAASSATLAKTEADRAKTEADRAASAAGGSITTISLPLPDPATLALGAMAVLTGTFAADVTSVLLTVDYVKGVKSWTGTVVSANAPVNTDGLPNGVTWIKV